MKHLKPLKFLGFLCLVAICTYYSYIVQNFLEKQIHDYKRQLVADTIQEDLSRKEITVDIKSKSAKSLDKLTVDDLRRALWVMSVRNGQLQDSLDTVRSALDYHQGDG